MNPFDKIRKETSRKRIPPGRKVVPSVRRPNILSTIAACNLRDAGLDNYHIIILTGVSI
jgi:hypothetical protein